MKKGRTVIICHKTRINPIGKERERNLEDKFQTLFIAVVASHASSHVMGRWTAERRWDEGSGSQDDALLF